MRKILLVLLMVAATAVASAPDRILVPPSTQQPLFRGIETTGLWK
jgi:hypothetical protein